MKLMALRYCDRNGYPLCVPEVFEHYLLMLCSLFIKSTVMHGLHCYLELGNHYFFLLIPDGTASG
jgi:hypothetical protein